MCETNVVEELPLDRVAAALLRPPEGHTLPRSPMQEDTVVLLLVSSKNITDSAAKACDPSTIFLPPPPPPWGSMWYEAAWSYACQPLRGFWGSLPTSVHSERRFGWDSVVGSVP